MNVCMCGSQAGFPHAGDCPFPYFGSDPQKESAWMESREKNQTQEDRYCVCTLGDGPTANMNNICGICEKPRR